MLLSLGFGAVALLLASIGLYGVLVYHVGQHARVWNPHRTRK